MPKEGENSSSIDSIADNSLTDVVSNSKDELQMDRRVSISFYYNNFQWPIFMWWQPCKQIKEITSIVLKYATFILSYNNVYQATGYKDKITQRFSSVFFLLSLKKFLKFPNVFKTNCICVSCCFENDSLRSLQSFQNTQIGFWMGLFVATSGWSSSLTSV